MRWRMPMASAVRVTTATAGDVTELAAVAAATFPLACPPAVTPENVAAFISVNLSPERFARYLADPDREVLIARTGSPIVGYALLIRGAGADPEVARAVTEQPAVELSKMYVLPEQHGAGVSAALMDAAIGHAADAGARCVWLGVNQNNLRAQRFYGKHGFAVSGTKTLALGSHVENDFVMVRSLVTAV